MRHILLSGSGDRPGINHLPGNPPIEWMPSLSVSVFFFLFTMLVIGSPTVTCLLVENIGRLLTCRGLGWLRCTD